MAINKYRGCFWGLLPSSIPLKSVDSEYPDAASQFTMQGAGIIELQHDHTVPPGRYVFSVLIENEGYSVVLDSIYTVIVE